jgi:hypothetical protein
MIKTRNRNPCCDVDENIMMSMDSKDYVATCRVCGSKSTEVTYIMDNTEWFNFQKKIANNLAETANHFNLSAKQTIQLIGGHPLLLK